jgi:hypothetical protein
MPGVKWTSKEQEKWLVAYFEEHYVPCMPTRNYTDFKPVFYEPWFKQWLEKTIFCEKRSLNPSGLTKDQVSKLSDAMETRKDVS